MKTTYLRGTIGWLVALAAVAGLRAAEPANVASPVEVTFVSPEKFTDASDRYGDKESNRDHFLERIKTHLVKGATARLAPGQKLAVTITDVDLAGRFEPWHGTRYEDVRVLRDFYPPRMTFTFTLTDSEGKVLKQGERQLLDGGYLLGNPGFPGDELRYDKGMIDNWLRAEFPRAKK